MNQGNEILGKDYEALQQMLRRYPGISIVSVEKDPPEQYEIEYRLFGYGYDANGEVQMLRRHRVQINLPFGYPHFPPTVRPLSKICHPDVAEHAVRIADYWQNNQSLAELVVHIGDMIRGAVYSTEAAFNSEAVEWYQANREKLPLAELERIDPDRKPIKAPVRREIPYKPIAILLAAVLVLGGGGLFARDEIILSNSARQLQKIKDYMDNRQFREANEVALHAADSLDSMFFLKGAGAERRKAFTDILDSVTMKEGLQGRIEHRGKYVSAQAADTLQVIELQELGAEEKLKRGDLEAANRILDGAMELAKKSGAKEAVDEVRSFSAEKKLAYFVDRGNASYADQLWQEAADEYGQATDILRDEAQYLSAESLGSLGNVEKLKTLSVANVYKQEAVQAENEGQFEQAANKYKSIAAMIRRSQYGADPALQKVANEADEEISRMGDQALIASGTSYLLENYKKIFLKQYPGLNETALQSPRVRYMGRANGKMVFLMSCIELIQRQANEFRLRYQYDPASHAWSQYRD